MTFIAEAGFVKAIGTVFHPIFQAIAWMLAFFYSIIPNYAVAIVLLTLLIMLVLTPFTVKSTRSMISMQRLQPEIKKLQQKYKGPEYRQELNEEMMKLYREEGVNPLGGCVPLLLQAPFLFILYNTIKGLSYKDALGNSIPRYIPQSSKMFHDIVAAHGQVKSFGIDLSLKALASHGSFGKAIPFFVIVALAVGLQYFQMAQINNRNRKTGQAIPSQQLMMQRFLPVLFAYFYLVIPAAVVLYMIVSTLVRIATQDIMFRLGITNPGANVQRSIPAREKDTEKALEKAPEATTKKAAKPVAPPKPPQHPRSKAKRQRKAR